MGHGRRQIDPEKAQLIRAFPIPRNCTEVRSFYGLVNFCRDFIPGFSTIATPLTVLSKIRLVYRTSLRYINTQPNLSRRMARWMETLQQYNLTIEYKRGDKNTIADFLSRNLAAELNLREVGLSSDISEFSRRPDHMPDFLSLGPYSVPVDQRNLLEGQSRHFEYDEEVGVLHWTEGDIRYYKVYTI